MEVITGNTVVEDAIFVNFKEQHRLVFEAMIGRRKLRNVYSTSMPLPERYRANWSIFNEIEDYQFLLNEPFNPDGPCPFVYMGIVDDSKCNARAEIYDGKYFIYFHAGTVLTFFSIFCRILSEPNNLKAIGNPELEQALGSHLWQVPDKIFDYEDISNQSKLC